MNSKNEYKDNVIIALSVALVVAVLCCAVMGVVLGIGGDISATTEVAEAYYASPDAPAEFFTHTWTGYYYSYFFMDFSSQVFGQYRASFEDVCDIINFDSDGKIPVYYEVSFALYFEDTGEQYAGTAEIGTYSQMNSSASYIVSSFNYSGDFYYSVNRLVCYSDELLIEFVNDGFDSQLAQNPEVEIEFSRISVSYFDIQSNLDEFYDSGYDFGFSDGNSEGLTDGYNNGYNVGYTEGHDVGYNDGYRIGKNDGFSQGVEQAGDYTFFSLITSVFDAPLRVLVGQWVDTDNDGVVDELVGGFLNFYIPVLDINLAPLILSIFTLCIIIVVIRFVLARL